jgi:hypothetical protein
VYQLPPRHQESPQLAAPVTGHVHRLRQPPDPQQMREELRIDPIRLLLRLRDQLHLEGMHHVDLRPQLAQQVHDPRRLVARFDRDPQAPLGVPFHGLGQPGRRG